MPARGLIHRRALDSLIESLNQSMSILQPHYSYFEPINKSMIKLSIVLFVALAANLAANADEAPSIFLPPDVETVTIVGNGFKMTVNQLTDIKKQWNEVAQETAQVVTPRKKTDETIVLNSGLYQATKNVAGETGYGDLDKDLLEWIVKRATALNDKVQRYQTEMPPAKAKSIEGTRVVLDILSVNTLVDLENLTNENIRSLRWIRNKLRSQGGYKESCLSEVDAYVKASIEAAKDIEKDTKGSNKPPKKWFARVQALKRILEEQRFSQNIGDEIIKFLGSKFNMMSRSNIYQHQKPSEHIEDGLYYHKVRHANDKEKLPSNFPFAAQDAIMNGA